MNDQQIIKFLKIVWHTCEARGRTFQSDKCSKHATHKIFSIKNSRQKKVQSESARILGLDLLYSEREEIVYSKCCSYCVNDYFDFLKSENIDENLLVEPIEEMKEILDFMKNVDKKQ